MFGPSEGFLTPAPRLLLLLLSAYALRESLRLSPQREGRTRHLATVGFLLASTLSPWATLGRLLLAVAGGFLLFSLAAQSPMRDLPITRRIRSRLAETSLLVGTFLALALEPVHAGGVGIALGLLLAIGTRRAPIGGENEASYPEVHRALLSGGTALALLLSLPAYAPARFSAPLATAVAGVSLFFLLFAGGRLLRAAGGGRTPEIRAFLSLLLPGLVVGSGAAFLPLEPFTRAGLLLFSRIPLALAALFILRQYTRWGFVAIRTCVIALVLFSTAGIVSFASALLSPVPLDPRPLEWTVLLGAAGALEAVLLLSLPAVVAHYDRGTMRVTWTLLTLSLYWEAALPVSVILDPIEAPPLDVRTIVLLSVGLASIAFLVASRYLARLAPTA